MLALVAVVAANPNQYARTLYQSQHIQPDYYQYEYSVDNGIKVEESGNSNAVSGRAEWVSPEGIPVNFQYTADENGYHATGSHVPATPEYVLRALEYIRSHPVYEDSYTPYVKSGNQGVTPYKAVPYQQQSTYKAVPSQQKQGAYNQGSYNTGAYNTGAYSPVAATVKTAQYSGHTYQKPTQFGGFQKKF